MGKTLCLRGKGAPGPCPRGRSIVETLPAVLPYSLNLWQSPFEILGLKRTTFESTQAFPLHFYFTDGETEAQGKISYLPKVKCLSSGRARITTQEVVSLRIDWLMGVGFRNNPLDAGQPKLYWRLRLVILKGVIDYNTSA